MKTINFECSGDPLHNSYVHGYDFREGIRLQDQASTLIELLHSDIAYPAGSRVLEAGCGVGAQTTTLAKTSPGAIFTSIDISQASLAAAKQRIMETDIANVHFQHADLFNLEFPPESFDHVFECFVLEHLSRPLAALKALKGVLKPGGTIVSIEGDHGRIALVNMPPHQGGVHQNRHTNDISAFAAILNLRESHQIMIYAGRRNSTS